MHETQSNTQPESRHFQCRHVFHDGHRCGSKCLRGEHFCYYHHASRRPAAAARQAGGPAAPSRRAPFDLPNLEDRSAVAAAISEVARRIAANQLDARRARLLLYSLQIASYTIGNPAAAPPADSVDEITLDPTLGPVAPPAELVPAKRDKTLEEILLEEWHKEP